VWKNDLLYCENNSCGARIGKQIEHFAKILSIKGLGEKTIEKLALNDITEIYCMDRGEVVDAIGEKLTDKLLNEIERSKKADLATVLSAMSIPLVGITAGKKLASVITALNQITQEACQKAGLGAKVTDNLLNWVSTDYQDIKEFLPFKFEGKIKEVNTNAKRVCITGKLSNYKKKSDAEGALSAAGFTLVDSVTKTTDYLVDEEGKGSSKRDKAVQYGIPIITDLNDLLKEI
jgi:DNA ligase (NAD+)